MQVLAGLNPRKRREKWKLKYRNSGGTSLASVDQIKKCVEIIKADDARRFVVVSAPGKRSKEDIKITDQLISCYQAASRGESIEPFFSTVRERFLEIAAKLNVGANLKEKLDEAEKQIQKEASYGYTVSRGEHFSARIVAEYIGYNFVDAADIILFDQDGKVSPRSYDHMAEILSAKSPAVIPGFYGKAADGTVQAFSRGGSDITGAVVAKGVKAMVYENWTDVSGLLQADPRIVDGPAPIAEVTYEELRELAALGANVFHEEAIHPVSSAGIPINIKNTNAPADAGTMILEKKDAQGTGITGVSGKTGISGYRFHAPHLADNLELQHSLKLKLIEMGWKVLYATAQCDSLLILMEPQENQSPAKEEVEALAETLKIEGVHLLPSLCMVGAVGDRLGEEGSLVATLAKNLSEAGIVPLVLAQGGSLLSFMVGIEERHYKKAITILAAAC